MKRVQDKGLGTSRKERATRGNSVSNLAKVGVVGSNPIARSNFISYLAFGFDNLPSLGKHRVSLRAVLHFVGASELPSHAAIIRSRRIARSQAPRSGPGLHGHDVSAATLEGMVFHDAHVSLRRLN